MVLDSMIKKGVSVVGRCCTTISQQIGAYRMFNNEKVEIEKISGCLYRHTTGQITCTHVLSIQDTTEVNYTSNMGRIGTDDPDIGPVTHNKDGGFYCHPVFVIDAQNKTPLGFLNIKLWNRSWDKKGKQERNYPALPIEEKESYRWIESAMESEKRLPQGVRQTIIADRESDIYEALHRIPGDRSELLIRSCSNRRLEGKDICLLEKMRSLPAACTYELEVKGNHSRKNRTARIALRFGPVTLCKPKDLKGDYPQTITVNCIHVQEHPSTVPAGEKPIEWRLLTTHGVESIQEAMRCVEWYKCRWYIEEIFRLLKSEGMDIEGAQLESGIALKKLVLFALVGAWHIMALKLAYDRKDENNRATVIFNDLQMEVLALILPSLEGKTTKQKNPYPKDSFVWAAWIVARLGGWTGYKSQAKPGYITFANGYRDLRSKCEVIELVKNVYRE